MATNSRKRKKATKEDAIWSRDFQKNKQTSQACSSQENNNAISNDFHHAKAARQGDLNASTTWRKNIREKNRKRNEKQDRGEPFRCNGMGASSIMYVWLETSAVRLMTISPTNTGRKVCGVGVNHIAMPDESHVTKKTKRGEIHMCIYPRISFQPLQEVSSHVPSIGQPY